MKLLPLACLATALGVLGGCSALPNAGPNTREIFNGADGKASVNKAVASPYSIVDIDSIVLSALEALPNQAFRGSFGGGGPSRSGALGVGDTVSVAIYESTTGGLFGSGDVGTGVGTKNTQLPPQQVDLSGNITVPFAGQVRAAGRTTHQVGEEVVRALSGKALEPQVLVTLVQNASNVVTVSGEVGQGGRFPISLGGNRVLDAIAQAGGPKAAAHDVFVRLNRGRRSAVMRFSALIARPDENVYLRNGDQIFLYVKPEAFTVLGAAGQNATIPFQRDRVMLSEALGQAGGLKDHLADASGLFIFRYENADVYCRVTPGRRPKGCVQSVQPIVYRLDLKRGESLLLAQRFEMRDKDVVYVSNSPSSDLQKFLGLIGTGVGIASTTASVAVSASR